MNEYFQIPKTIPCYACIWMHGLGASGQDMRMIAEAMPFNHDKLLRHVFLDAPKRPVSVNQGMVMPAWYDIYGMKMTDRADEGGIKASTQLIHETINALQKQGFQSEKIYLAGFSQGGAMAFYAALTYAKPLAGAIALSGYLPMADKVILKQPATLPIYVGYGRYDSIVMPAWTQETVLFLKENNYKNITVEDYPIDHSVCPEEIVAFTSWMTR